MMERNTILRFDHISKVCSRSDYIDDGAYKFSEIGIENTIGRFAFMDFKEKNIDMYFYENDFPVEIVLYDQITGYSQIRVEENMVVCKADIIKINLIKNVFYLLGFEPSIEDELKWKISGMFNSKVIYLRLELVENIETIPINWGGWNCPCFLVKSVSSLFEKLRNEYGIVLSEVNQLSVNGKCLDIGFLKIKGLEMSFEFISLHKDKRC